MTLILVDRGTKVLVQGITGREASAFTRDMLDYGTKVVGGVVPGRGGDEVHGLQVYDTVSEALSEHKADAAIVSVPPNQAKDAALEAVEAGIQLVLIFTERLPRRDVAEVIEFAEEAGTRIVGPNSLGIISPSRAKIGAIGGPKEETRRAYKRGPAAIISRSGGMTTEVASMLTARGIGQSTCISIGGDPIVGSSFADLLPLFEEDKDTKVVVLFCEPGGVHEEEAARYLHSSSHSKPVIAFVAGRFVDEMPGTRFGHAGVIVEDGRGTARGKVEALKEAGVTVADELSQIPLLVASFLK